MSEHTTGLRPYTIVDLDAVHGKYQRANITVIGDANSVTAAIRALPRHVSYVLTPFEGEHTFGSMELLKEALLTGVPGKWTAFAEVEFVDKIVEIANRQLELKVPMGMSMVTYGVTCETPYAIKIIGRVLRVDTLDVGVTYRLRMLEYEELCARERARDKEMNK